MMKFNEFLISAGIQTEQAIDKRDKDSIQESNVSPAKVTVQYVEKL